MFCGADCSNKKSTPYSRLLFHQFSVVMSFFNTVEWGSLTLPTYLVFTFDRSQEYFPNIMAEDSMNIRESSCHELK